MAAYLARYPVVTFGSRGCHLAFLACISSSETLISSFSSGMLMLMISPSSTSAIGPPTAASGDTCPMDAPLDAPLKRPSVINISYLPASEFARPGEADQEHLDELGHSRLADAIYEKLAG